MRPLRGPRQEKALEALPEVSEAVVSHTAGTAIVTLTADVSNETLKRPWKTRTTK